MILIKKCFIICAITYQHFFQISSQSYNGCVFLQNTFSYNYVNTIFWQKHFSSFVKSLVGVGRELSFVPTPPLIRLWCEYAVILWCEFAASASVKPGLCMLHLLWSHYFEVIVQHCIVMCHWPTCYRMCLRIVITMNCELCQHHHDNQRQCKYDRGLRRRFIGCV